MDEKLSCKYMITYSNYEEIVCKYLICKTAVHTLYRSVQYTIPFCTVHYTVLYSKLSVLYSKLSVLYSKLSVLYSKLSVLYSTLYRSVQYTIPFCTVHYTVLCSTLLWIRIRPEEPD